MKERRRFLAKSLLLLPLDKGSTLSFNCEVHRLTKEETFVYPMAIVARLNGHELSRSSFTIGRSEQCLTLFTIHIDDNQITNELLNFKFPANRRIL